MEKLRLYNTLTRKKGVFKPLEDGEVKIYSCGPTVYWYQHIGNLKSYTNWDVLKRVLKYNGYKVNHIMNVTDVGHLTSDDDTGEDKIEKAAKKEGKNAGDISEFYFNHFKKDFEKLNIIPPSKWPKATNHIKEMIKMVKILKKKRFTYETSDGIYFDTSKLDDYGKLARLNIEELEAGKRVDMKEKKNKTDFALWKFSQKKRQQEWKAFGKLGFPGWHIECSAMSSKYLGKQFDIHTGGEDHISVHHTNEIAQSEAAFGKIPAKYWLHSAFLTTKGEKVSKSKGGLYTISQLEEKGFNPLSFRYFVLNGHYRTQLEFSIKALKQAQNSYERLKNIIKNLWENKEEEKVNKEYLKKFEKEINDDLNTPKALAVLWELVRDEKAGGKLETIKEMDKVLGLRLLEKKEIEVPDKVKRLAEKRWKLRGGGEYKEADKIREKVKKLGFYINDTEDGWEIVKNED
jgi:cysteinyl-tRNA synthetase